MCVYVGVGVGGRVGVGVGVGVGVHVHACMHTYIHKNIHEHQAVKAHGRHTVQGHLSVTTKVCVCVCVIHTCERVCVCARACIYRNQ